MTQLSSSDVPGMGRRQFMNLLTFGSVTGVALGALYPVANYFIPPKAAGSGGGTSAKDELGNPITASGWLSSHPEGDRSLVQGLKGDPTYLIVEGEDAIGSYGINAICTHLGCVVPWNAGANKFMCPCHGGVYYEDGSRASGPPPRGLYEYANQVKGGRLYVFGGEIPNLSIPGKTPKDQLTPLTIHGGEAAT